MVCFKTLTFKIFNGAMDNVGVPSGHPYGLWSDDSDMTQGIAWSPRYSCRIFSVVVP